MLALFVEVGHLWDRLGRWLSIPARGIARRIRARGWMMATIPVGANQGLLACPAGVGMGQGVHAKAAVAAAKGAGGAVGLRAALGGSGNGAGLGAGVGAGKGFAATKGAVACGATGKSLSLGLGIGLGLWGPGILAGLGVAAAYTLWRSRSAVSALSEEDLEMGEALSERAGARPIMKRGRR